MEVRGIEIHKIHVTFSVDDDELDKLSLALSICEMTPRTDEEKAAAEVLSKFSGLINEMLDRVKEGQ